MGAPKHKWSREEESALRSAIAKYGPGRWRTILKDPAFSRVLYLRSNVDLKDKWRNISVMGHGSGSGSRSKSSVAVKRTHSSLPSDEEILEMVDAKDPSTTAGSSALQVPSQRTPNWLDSLITEAISTMKEGGSSKTAIAKYIQERYEVPPNFKTLLSSKLKKFSAFGTGKLIKVKRKYRIPNSTALSSHKKSRLGTLSDKKSIPPLPSSPETDRDEMSVETESEDDAELARMMIVSIHEAAETAAQAVAEAEAAMVEADEAAKQADVAEAEAEAAQAFAEEVSKTLKVGGNCSVMIHS